MVQYWQDGTVQRRPDQEPNGSYTFFVGPLGFGAPCRAWAVQAIRVISVMSECPPMQLPGAGRCSQVRNLVLATAARRRASTQKLGQEQEHLAHCALGERRWRGKVAGKGGWGLMQNTDWVVCVVCGLRNGGGLLLQSFHSSKASSTHSTLPPRSATPQAGPQQLFVNRRPFHAVANPQIPSRVQLLPSGEAGKCTLLGLTLRPQVEL